MVRLIKFHTGLGLRKLSDLLPTYRNEVELRINDLFLITPDKYKILGWLKCGFRADWAAAMPKIISNPPNFLHSAAALAAARERLTSEVRKGRLLGGPGWTREVVRDFLGKDFYVIPCGAVPKNDNPVGRIIHNYSYPSPKEHSVNSALVNTSVAYISFKERVKKLAKVEWYVKADLKNGYRQLPVHPSDWYTQVYALGPSEHYIDLNMPFGKANSSKIFCTWTSSWCYSFRVHFKNRFSIPISLATYIDDFFGGPISSGSLSKDEADAKLLLSSLIDIGNLTSTYMNMEKCVGPRRCLEIIGHFYNAIKKTCSLSSKKANKYILRLSALRIAKSAVSKDLEKIVGYLGFAAWVIPYGRPFISHLSFFLDRKNDRRLICLDASALAACDIWLVLLKANWGLPYKFILGKLPRHKNAWFVDASTSYGYGGVCGSFFFKTPHAELRRYIHSNGVGLDPDFFIAYRELLAALFAFLVFANHAPRSFIRLYSDNKNTVAWLNKGRCSKALGFSLLAAVEFFKAKYGLKVKAVYLPSSKNTSADALSRGKTPMWLRRRGVRKTIKFQKLFAILTNPVVFWEKLVNPFKEREKASSASVS